MPNLESSDSRLKRGKEYFEKGEYSKSIHHFKKVLIEDPFSQPALEWTENAMQILANLEAEIIAVSRADTVTAPHDIPEGKSTFEGLDNESTTKLDHRSSKIIPNKKFVKKKDKPDLKKKDKFSKVKKEVQHEELFPIEKTIFQDQDLFVEPFHLSENEVKNNLNTGTATVSAPDQTAGKKEIIREQSQKSAAGLVKKPIDKTHSEEDFFDIGFQLYRKSDFFNAYEYFQKLLKKNPDHKECQRYKKITEEILRKKIVTKIGSFDKIPVLQNIDPSEFNKFAFSPEEGFLLSRIDGNTSFKHLSYFSQLKSFETYRFFEKILDMGLIRIK